VFDATDPRANLGDSKSRGQSSTARRPQLFELDGIEPTQVDLKGSQTWWIRSQNLVVAFTRARGGSVLQRAGQPDAYMAMLRGPNAQASISADGGGCEITSETLAIIDAEDSEIAIAQDCVLLRMFSSRSEDLAALCLNTEAYRDPDPNVTLLPPAPHSRIGGVTTYVMAEIPKMADRFGRIYSSDALMLNYMYAEEGPRDPDRLSPHSHDDFEQVSIQLEGNYIHDLRTPWTPRLCDWQPDEHLAASSPAILVIPPPLVHTSRWVGEGLHQLADAFAPPRPDFSEMPGWLLNASDDHAAAVVADDAGSQ
jgi:hypothetical protein